MQKYLPTAATKYSYLAKSDRGSNYNNDTINYDTMYQYTIRYNDTLDLDYFKVNKYNSDNSLQSHFVYDVNNGIPRLSHVDSYVYRKERLSEIFRFCLNSGCIINVNTSDNSHYGDDLYYGELFLYSRTKHFYKHNRLARIEIQYPATLKQKYPSISRHISTDDKENILCFRTYEYNDEGKPILTNTSDFFYKNGNCVNEIYKEYSNDDTVWSNTVTYFNDQNQKISDTTFTKWSNKNDIEYKVRSMRYDNKALLEVYNYSISDNNATIEEDTWYYSYTPFGYVYEWRYTDVTDRKVEYVYEAY